MTIYMENHLFVLQNTFSISPGLLNMKLEDTNGASVIGRQSFSSALPWNANLQGIMVVYYLLSYSHLHLSGSTQVRLCMGSNLDN